jgi:uncharacterized protein
VKRTWIFIALLLSYLNVSSASVSLPMPTNYVEDKAGIIAADYERRINGLLQELEQKTGVQFIVLTVPSTGSVPIEMYSIELVEQWKLGQADKDNGFLLTIAFEDRKYRFEVGYGLEGFLTDQYCGRVGRQILAPAMKQGQASEGIYQTVLAIANKIATHYGVQLSGIPAGYRDPVSRRSGTPCCTLIIPLLLFLFIILAASGRGSVFWPLWFLFGMQYGAHRNPYNRGQRGYWGYTGGGFGSGGFGSGGFGGFGGGGGGSFGGGGASGGW